MLEKGIARVMWRLQLYLDVLFGQPLVAEERTIFLVKVSHTPGLL